MSIIDLKFPQCRISLVRDENDGIWYKWSVTTEGGEHSGTESSWESVYATLRKHMAKHERTDDQRNLLFDFIDLPLRHRIGVAQTLGLLQDEDWELSAGSMYDRLYDRSKKSHRLELFWEEVQKLHHAPKTVNPFMGK